MTSIQDKATLEEQANTTHTRHVWRENKTLERGKKHHKNLENTHTVDKMKAL